MQGAWTVGLSTDLLWWHEGTPFPLFERLDGGQCMRSMRGGPEGSRCVPKAAQPQVPRRTPA